MDLTPARHAPASADIALATEAIAAPADFHYASIYLPPARRAAVRTLEAVRRAVAAVPSQCSDRGVAHLKLAWWDEEFTLLARGAPRHPLSEALLRDTDVPLPRLAVSGTRLVHAVIGELRDTRLASRADVLAHIAGVHGECWNLLFAPAGSAQLADGPARLAALIELAYELRGLRQHRRGGTLYLADEALAAHGLSVDRVRDARSSAELGTMAAHELGWVRAELAAAVARLDGGERRRQAALVTLARCAQTALDLTLADGCQLLERRIELLPVHKLWLAWRSHRLPRW